MYFKSVFLENDVTGNLPKLGTNVSFSAYARRPLKPLRALVEAGLRGGRPGPQESSARELAAELLGGGTSVALLYGPADSPE